MKETAVFNRRRIWTLTAVLVICAVFARLPFLLAGEFFFDSDEAVEGLMARHVLAGELPVFYWGQGYKGVPEVYIAAIVFAAFGSSVVGLKAVTLLLFALFVALHFRLIAKLFSTGTAFASSLLLIFCPPALVYWSLSANAELVLTMLLGSVLLLLLARWEDTRSDSCLRAAAFTAGCALWVHQLIIYYLLPIALVCALRSNWWREKRSVRLLPDFFLARKAAATVRPLLWLLNTALVVYMLLSAIAFLTCGFSVEVAGRVVSVHHPQKMLRIALGLLAISAAVRAVPRYWPSLWASRKRMGSFAAAFFLGYSPALYYALFVGRAGTPMRRMDLADLVRALPSLAGDILPILAGFKSTWTQPLDVPVWLGIAAWLSVAAFLWSSRTQIWGLITLRAGETSWRESFLPFYLVLAPAVFLVSGVFLDAQSHRYLIPLYAALPTASVLGVRSVTRGKAVPTILAVGAIMSVFAWQQVSWFRLLAPDLRSNAILQCLQDRGVRGGYADYWLSYKLTFLSDEAIIIAPVGQMDRYPPFASYVAGLPCKAYIGAPALSERRPSEIAERVSCGGLMVGLTGCDCYRAR